MQDRPLSVPLEPLEPALLVGGVSSPPLVDPEEPEEPDEPEEPVPVEVPLHATSTIATKASEAYRMA